MKEALTNKCIGFIGVGVMGSSIIKSLITAALPANQICIADKSQEKADQITATYKVAKQSISQIGQNCEVIFLAVKPQDLGDVLVELSKSLKSETLLISIAAGKTTRFIEEKLSTNNPVVRVMPNTPAQIGKAVSAISGGSNAKPAHLELTKELFSASGVVVEVPEENQDAVTALSGSGPAYFFISLNQ